MKIVKLFCKCIILLFIFSNTLLASNQIRLYHVFEKIQNRTGQWNINIKIVPNSKSLLLDKSNTIFISEQIIDLCYRNHSESEGNDRLAFLLSHEFAHLMNNDLDYDRILNPFNKKLSNEPLEIRKQKEINADLRAISILNIAGFTSEQFNDHEKNIITDLYKFHGINNKKKNFNNYPSAVERIKNINQRKKVLSEYNYLYECGIFLLLFSSGNEEFLELASEAFQSFQNYTVLTTPELLNNLGLCYLGITKSNYSKEFVDNPDSINFMKFETSFVINSEVQPIRTIGLLDNSPVTEKKKVEQLKFNIYFKKALNCFVEADRISDDNFIPSKFNQVVLLGLNQQYKDAKNILDGIAEKHFTKLLNCTLLPYYYNLKGIIEYCMGGIQNSSAYFDKALEENPDFITTIRNKNITKKSKSYIAPFENQSRDYKLPPLITCLFETYKTLNIKPTNQFTFGPRNNYDFQYTENDSIKTFTIRVKISPSQNYTPEIEIIKFKKGGIKGKNFIIGSGKQQVLSELYEDHSIIFSSDKTFYHYKNASTIFCFNKEEVLEEIVMLKKVSF